MQLNICIMISITIDIVVGSCNGIYAITVNASKTRGYVNTIPRSVVQISAMMTSKHGVSSQLRECPRHCPRTKG